MTRSPRRAGRLLVLCALVSVAACGGEPASSSSTASAGGEPSREPASDACALVTAADASEALGAQVGEPERPAAGNIPPRLSTCRFTAPAGQGVAVLTVMVRRGESDNESRIGFRATRDQFPDAETIALGDEAFYAADQLNVLKGRAYLNITGSLSKEAARSLAQRALERLN